MPSLRRSTNALAVASVAVAAVIGVSLAAPTPSAFAQQSAAPMSVEAKAAAAAQAAAEARDEEGMRALAARAAVVDAQRAAAEQAEAERAAAAAQAEADRQAAAAATVQRALADPRAVAADLVAERGWGAEQFSCLNKLWERESDWDPQADNPTSSAYGIPQALPGTKMAAEGADWQTNPVTQMRWGLGYIDEVYGSPCAAWAHSEATNWY